MKCFYGCDQEGIRFFTCTKRWCCSENVNRCPAKRKRDSLKKKGKPLTQAKSPRGAKKGQTPWNKGKKVGPFSEERRRQISLSHMGIRHSEETKKKISDAAKNGKMGGYRHGSGRSNGSWYESPIAGRVYLDSSYELAFAKFLDEGKVPWVRNQDRFPYHHEGKERKYIPDFFLPLADCFIEIKGFETELDRTKWRSLREQHQKTLLVFFEQELKTMGVL